MLPTLPQYILWKPVASSRPGKTDKLPLDYRTLTVASAHDPACWLTCDSAKAAAAAWGLGVGYVINANDPYWFLDIDNCLVGGAWSPLAVDLCGLLAGAFVEVSYSGTGLHVIGSGQAPAHSCRGANGLEFYTADRFVALTGTHARGDAQHDCSAVLPGLVARYFPARAGAADAAGPAVLAAEWTDAPCAEWSGPADDDELVSRMLASTSAAAAFGNRASPRDLWTADAAALGRAFPSEGREYDASSADAALARHLAFWTGRDCERIRRLMQRSALSREKWEREDYLPRTIIAACRGAKEVLGRSVAPGVPAPPSAPDPSAPATAAGGFVTASEMPEHFKGCVYIEDRYAAAVPDGSILDPQQFRSSGRYGGYKFLLDEAKTTRNAWEAFAEGGTYRPPLAHSMCFRPEMPARALLQENGRTLFNSYVPVQVRRLAGDPGPFLAHLAKLLPQEADRAILLAWMASAAQNVGVKFQWSPLIQGCEGNGKTILVDVMAYAIGEEYCHRPNAQDVANKFNQWLDRKLFIAVEEVYTRERKELEEALKLYITNRRVEMQSKGSNQTMIDNRANFMLLTNHKDAIGTIGSGRRYCSLLTAQQEYADIVRDGMDGSYFPDLYAWLRADGFAIVAHYLQTYAVPVALDPAGACHRAPQTSSTAEAVEAAQSPVEQAVLEAIASGERGFQGGWVSSHFLGLLLDARRLRTGCPPNAWDSVLQKFGYIKHPALPNGRVNNIVSPDGIKSRLWVKRDSIPALNYTTAADVARAYSAANGGFGAAAVA